MERDASDIGLLLDGHLHKPPVRVLADPSVPNKKHFGLLRSESLGHGVPFASTLLLNAADVEAYAIFHDASWYSCTSVARCSLKPHFGNLGPSSHR